MHISGRVCNENGIVYKLTKPYHPWTNGQAERMNRTIKEATVKAFHYPDLESLRAHVLAFVCAFNFAMRLKSLRWKTPYQTIVDAWQKTPSILRLTLVTSSRDHTPSACGMVGFSTATFSVKYLCTHTALITILIFANS